MDNLTHSLVGVMMSRAGLGRTTERGGVAMMILAANVPDIDVVMGLPGSLNYLRFHRGLTHSLLLSPLMALIALLLARWIVKCSIRWSSYLACLMGVLSHLLLDLTNVYGVRLLLPFSSRWLRLDMDDIIDPWILFMLVLALAVPALASLVSSEIGGRRVAGPKQTWAWIALVAIMGYEGFRLASHQRAIAIMASRLYGSLTTPRFTAIPDRIDPLRWRGVVETEDFVLTVSVLLTEDYNPAVFGHVDYPTRQSAAIDAARTTEPFRVFESFNQLPFWRVSSTGENIRVELIDMRFGTPKEPGFAVATAIVTSDDHVLEAHFGFPLSR